MENHSSIPNMAPGSYAAMNGATAPGVGNQVSNPVPSRFDLKALYAFHKAQAFWVSRPKENMQFATLEQMEITDAKSGILEDSRIKVTGYKSSKLYPEDMRFVRIYGSSRNPGA